MKYQIEIDDKNFKEEYTTGLGNYYGNLKIMSDNDGNKYLALESYDISRGVSISNELADMIEKEIPRYLNWDQKKLDEKSP